MKKLLILALGSLCFLPAISMADQLQATIMGSSSPNYNEQRASAGVLISKGGTQILVDMGPGVRANLYRAGINDRKIDALMFTHHHIDHDAEFNSMLVRGIVGRDAIAVYGPKDTVKLTNLFLDFYKDDLNYRLGKSGRTLKEREEMITSKDLKSGESFSIEGIKVTTLQVPHTIETLAYRFDYNDQSIVVTGDLTYTDKLGEFAKGANCMIIDSGGTKMVKGTEMEKKRKNGGAQDEGEKAHLDLNDSSSMAKQAGVDSLVYTHFLPGTVDEKASLAIINKQYSGNVVFSTDLMKLNCGNH